MKTMVDFICHFDTSVLIDDSSIMKKALALSVDLRGYHTYSAEKWRYHWFI